MSTTTPAPWKHEYLPQHRIRVTADNGRITICEIALWKDPGEYSEQWCNGQAISALPELLAACREFVRKVECGEARSKRSYAQMKSAIEKAIGRGGGIMEPTQAIAPAGQTALETAAERDRLKAVNEELLAAMNKILEWTDGTRPLGDELWLEMVEIARLAIAKAEGRKLWETRNS